MAWSFSSTTSRCLSYAAESTATAISGALGLFAGDAGIGFSQVLVFKQPITTIQYLDGTRRKVQGQQLVRQSNRGQPDPIR